MMVIPQDIIDSIIEAVGDDSHLLKSCSLVSSEFLLPARKHLFSSISLRNDEPGCRGLHQFLVENPVLQPFVRTIHVYMDLGDLFCDESYYSVIPTLQLPFCSLESFSICPLWEDRLDWNDFSSELKDAISTIIHSSTLASLHLIRIDVPITLFQGIQLTKLVLHSVLPQFHLGGEQSRLPVLTPSAFEEEEESGIDQIVWSFQEPMHDLPDPMFLPFMSHVRNLEIHVNPRSTTLGHFSILTFLILSLRGSSSPATLEHLRFSITIQVDEDMLDNDAFYDDLESDIVWSSLDSIATHPAGSRLQRVDVDISFCYDDGRVDAFESILDDDLPLPLLREKGILFIQGLVCDSLDHEEGSDQERETV